MHRFRYASNTVELISCELLQDRRADRLKPERPQPQKGGTRGLQSVQGVTWRFLREGPRQQTLRERADASGGDARSEALQVRPQTTTCPHSIIYVSSYYSGSLYAAIAAFASARGGAVRCDYGGKGTG